MREDGATPGFRLLGTREDIAALEAIDTTILKNGSLVFVTEPAVIYALLKDSTSTADGEEVVQPSAGPGRWFAQTSSSSGAGTPQTIENYYIDPVNGDDSNDGLTPATAFLTYQYGASPRLAGALVAPPNNAVILNQMGSVAQDDVFWATTFVTGEDFVEIAFVATGVEATLLTGVITAATNASTTVRGQFTVAGADFTGMENKRVRVIAGANVNSAGVITRVISPTTVFITQPVNMTTFSVSGQFTVGQTIAVEDLYRGPAITGSNRTPWGISGEISVESLHFESSPSAVFMFGLRGEVSFVGCRVIAETLRGILGFFACYLEVEELMGFEYLFFENTAARVRNIRCQEFEMSRSETLSGFTIKYGNVSTRNYHHCWDWSTADLAAITLEPGTSFDSVGRVTGTSANANTYGIRVRSGARFIYPNAANKPTVAGAAGFNVDVGGVQLLYAAVPASSAVAANHALMTTKL